MPPAYVKPYVKPQKNDATRIFCAIVEPPTARLIGNIADYFYRRSVRPKPVGYN
jgi:hypothetical protein